jgi:hypothetical protein
MTQQADVDAKCSICSGTKAEHKNSRHAFTTIEGDLTTPEEMRKRNAPPTPPQLIRLPGGTHNEGGAINRLIEVLMNKGIFSTDEALYICGIKPTLEAPSGFADPAVEPRRVMPC